ncbi:MAG: RagB/SusD family nutrient uptake outer membrane protein [Algibacter sp.]|uniref:RagB/SusD family nutrient uptake outer membrane protein n=1 Tax=Algibacter sp. TaxID=1872428 RepID=UPI00262CF1A2|nr:RagB/SusD family nutrient uptake outer membrane protein [Algibacter sp.]MDG1729326.1 RagB/SusD family nutrient uptake outer membrane protein [Algibacter sp.]MDG2179045.1 RagB/SusD family nutrient uptake outer membrane protein [Algibacter sp.]
MKTLKYLILLTVLVFSCSDLDEQVYSEISPSNFYQNADEANAGVISIYNSYSRSVGLFDFGLASMVIMPSPNMVARVPWRAYWGTYVLTSAEPISLPRVWNSFYQAIFRANVVIKELEGRTFNEDEEEARLALIGEAKWLRAWSYFNLVQLFGGVPMPLEPTTSIDGAKLPRTDITAVYDQIILDLQDAEAMLPEEKRTGEDIGRPFAATAKFLLSKVYLTMSGKPLQDASKLSLAQSKLQELINLEGTSEGFVLLNSYEDAIRTDNNAERIFAVQQTQSFEDQGTAFSHVWGGRFRFSAGVGQFHGGLSQDFYDSFEPNDLRRDVTMAYTYTDYRNGNTLTYGTNPYQPRFGIAQNKYVDFDQTCCDGDPDMIVYRYSDALLMAAEIENAINGPTAVAYEYLNRVRFRANASDAPSNMTQEEFTEFIYEERFKELSFEFHEVYDIRRFGKVEEALANHPENIRWNPANTAYQSYFDLWPIPLDEINANPNIGQQNQNPGW